MLNFRSLNRLCSIRLNLKRTCGCWFGKALFLSWNVNGNSNGISQCTFLKYKRKRQRLRQLLNHTASFDRSLFFRPLNGPCPKVINGISQEVIYTLQLSDSNSSSFFFIPAFCFSSSAFFIWTSVSWWWWVIRFFQMKPCCFTKQRGQAILSFGIGEVEKGDHGNLQERQMWFL